MKDDGETLKGGVNYVFFYCDLSFIVNGFMVLVASFSATESGGEDLGDGMPLPALQIYFELEHWGTRKRKEGGGDEGGVMAEVIGKLIDTTQEHNRNKVISPLILLLWIPLDCKGNP
jgi:hypothetical protein